MEHPVLLVNITHNMDKTQAADDIATAWLTMLTHM